MHLQTDRGASRYVVHAATDRFTQFVFALYLAMGLWLGPALIAGTVSGLFGFHAGAASVLALLAFLFHVATPRGRLPGNGLNVLFSTLAALACGGLTSVIGAVVHGLVG